MIKLPAVIGRSLRLWWDEAIVMVLLNLAWFLLQLPIITSLPATAVVYTMARRSYEGEYWGPRDAWEALRRLFWPAWRWGLLNGAVLLVLYVNFTNYWNAAGAFWHALRLIWLAAAAVWLALNFFYWPFWLAQEDKSLRTTYANCGRFLLLNPLVAAALLIFCVAASVLSVLTVLPFAMFLISWLALIGMTAVQESLSWHKQKQQEA